MSDMMVIVSKAVFDDVQDGDGNRLAIGSVYETDTYVSKSKTIEKNLTGDLYLVTVRDDQLWLVAHLAQPEHDGEGWVADVNTRSIVDITSVAGEIEFTNGKGIKLDKMAMSLQTPRTLSDADVALLNDVWANVREPVEVTEDQIERAVVQVLQHILERSEEEIRNDPKRYAALHWDDGFNDYYFYEIDWENPSSFEVEFQTEDWLFGRGDIDLERSLIEDEHFYPSSTTDTSLQRLFEKQGGTLYGKQLSELVKQDRLSIQQLDFPTVHGRIKSDGETLVDAGKALLMLNDFPTLRLVPGEYAEVDEEYEALLDRIEPRALAEHIGMFFQTADSARCCGAAWDGPSDLAHLGTEENPAIREITSWWIGEGQGDCSIVEILDDTMLEVPAFEGRELLIKTEEEIPERSRPFETGTSEELAALSLREHFAGIEHEDYRAFLDAVGDRDIETFISGMTVSQPDLWKLLIPIGAFRREGNARGGLALLKTARKLMNEEERNRTEYDWAIQLHSLHCWEEAVQAFERCVQLGQACTKYMLNEAELHNRYSRAALDAGKPELAVREADLANADGDLGIAIASKGSALFLLGQEEEAFEHLEKAMAFGFDPDPPQVICEHERYRELALQYSIPVRMFH